MRDKPTVTSRICHILLRLTALALLFAPVTAFAKSCPFCYTQAAASSLRFGQALRSGILILMIPPFFLSVGITVLTYRRRNYFHSEAPPWTPDTEVGRDSQIR